jgi:hypothetical protein
MKMRRTTHAVALLAASVFLSAASMAKDNSAKPDEAGARTANQARFDAAVSGDTSALDKLLADDLDYCHSNGDCESKRVYLDSMKAGTMKYRSIQPAVDSAKVIGTVAVLLGHASISATRNGSDLNMQIGYTSVFAWRDGRWQLTSWRSITLPERKP